MLGFLGWYENTNGQWLGNSRSGPGYAVQIIRWSFHLGGTRESPDQWPNVTIQLKVPMTDYTVIVSGPGTSAMLDEFEDYKIDYIDQNQFIFWMRNNIGHYNSEITFDFIIIGKP